MTILYIFPFFFAIGLFLFILRYHVYFQDNKKNQKKIRFSLFNRYSAVYALNIFLGVEIGLRFCDRSILLGLSITAVWIAFFGFMILWYPFYLKHKRPDKYKGLWKAIGEWLGEWGLPGR